MTVRIEFAPIQEGLHVVRVPSFQGSIGNYTLLHSAFANPPAP